MGEETRRQGDKGTRRRKIQISLSPTPLVSLSPCPLVPLSPSPLFPFLLTGYIGSYQNSRSSFRAIKSQTQLRGRVMKNRRLALAVVIVFVTLMTGRRL